MPVNDNFANRILLSGSAASATGSNIGATGELGEPSQSGVINSAWWSWTPSYSGTYTIDTKKSNFDTWLSVFDGNQVNYLNLIKSDDDAGGNLTSLVSLYASAGATYQIAVDGFSGNTGNIQLNIVPVAIYGTRGRDFLVGTAYPETINGLGEHDQIYGKEGNDTLNGDEGDDRLDGGLGADKLAGGLGIDTYVVDNVGDVINELPDQGIDRVESSITYTLPAEVENLSLSGTTAINGTGNNLANVITGNDANNLLDGSTGVDQLTGRLGNDIYVVDNAGDKVTELADEGTDEVRSIVTYTLSAEVENLSLSGTAAINGTGNNLANVITGNDANNTLDGGIGADTLAGSLGNDIYAVDNAGDVVTELAGGGTDEVRSIVTYTLPADVENLRLGDPVPYGDYLYGTGNTLPNVIIGNQFNNTLDGRSGADTLIGGLMNDFYTVDNVGDVVIELENQGVDDKVNSTVSHTLSAHVEDLNLYGTAAINGTGNNLANEIRGNEGNNVLNGGIGADTLMGGSGANTLIGGVGDDYYGVDNVGDIITELAGEGTDRVESLVSYTLPAEVENLSIWGAAAINGTGNTLANTIRGGHANNTLNGGGGQDILTGGSGADTFLFKFGESSVSAKDSVEDFVIGTDKIDLLTQSGAVMSAPSSFSRAADNSTATTLQLLVDQVFIDTDGGLAGNQALGIDSAALVVTTNSSIVGNYLVINDATAGFQASNDLVIKLTTTGTFPPVGGISVTNFFA